MRPKRYRKIMARVFGSVWAITPGKLGEILQVLDLRERGIRLTKGEIRAQVGTPPGMPLLAYHAADDPYDVIEPAGSGETLEVGSRIAVLNLFGTISQRMNLLMEFSGGTSTEMFSAAFAQAIDDESVRAVVLNVDSPGGAVPGIPELAEEIYAARGTKPIVAVVNPMMASGALWLASAADEIVAIPSASDIGSLGVIAIHRGEQRANEEAGLDYEVFRSVPFKAEGLPVEPLSDETRAHVNSEIQDIHAEFAGAVARYRGLDPARITEQYGNGRTFRAEEAVRRKMVDRIATFDDVIAELAGTPPEAAGERRAPSMRTPGRQRTESPQGSLTATRQRKRRTGMDPKIKLALVQRGLVEVRDDDETCQAALALFYRAEGLNGGTVPEDTAQIVKDLAISPAVSDHQQNRLQERTVQSEGISLADITGLVRTAGHMLPAEEQLALQTELVEAHAEAAAGGTRLGVSDVLERINQRAVRDEGNRAAGHAEPVEATRDAMDKFHVAARDAIICASVKPGQVAEAKQIFDYSSGEYVDWKPGAARTNYGLQSPIKIAMQCMLALGLPANKVFGLSKSQVARLVCGASPADVGLRGLSFGVSSDGPAYNLTGMFSNIFLDAANVVLRMSYDDARVTFDRWMNQGQSLEDFKPVNKVIAGELSDPKAVPEDGEFEETTLTDGKESYKLTVWGEIFSHSWQVMVNDRLGSFMEAPMKLGRAMRRKQNRLAYQLVKDNAALADGVALFNSATHSNVTTGALTTTADYVGAWNTMAQKLAEQTGLSSDSGALNLMAQYCVFPPAIRGIILQSLRSMSADTTNPGLTNIWEGQLEPIEDAELGAAFGGSDTAFYHAVNPSDCDTIEYAYLQGLEAPVIEQATAFSSLAIRQRIYQAFAVKALDFRGLQQHTGAA